MPKPRPYPSITAWTISFYPGTVEHRGERPFGCRHHSIGARHLAVAPDDKSLVLWLSGPWFVRANGRVYWRGIVRNTSGRRAARSGVDLVACGVVGLFAVGNKGGSQVVQISPA